MNKALWRHIYSNNLVSGNMVVCDEILQKVFLGVRCNVAYGQERDKQVKRLYILHSPRGLLDIRESLKNIRRRKVICSQQKGRRNSHLVIACYDFHVGKVLTTRKNFRLTPELQAIVGSSHCTRSDCLKKVWEYIRTHNLHSQEKKVIENDSTMQAVFGLKEMKSSDIMVWCT